MQDGIAALLRAQDGVVCRAQALAAGLDDADIRRLVRRREWAVLHPGVYVDHTGPPTWRQRAWAAVLVARPAVLGGRAALAVSGIRLGSADPRPIEVTVPTARTVRAPSGIVVRRSDGTWSRATHWLSPPRLGVEDAALDVAAASRREIDAVAVLAGVVSSRRTTADRMRDTLALRPRLPRYALLSGVLEDVAKGVHSALEREYLVRVERPHGLPPSVRQSVQEGAYRDVLYEAHGLVVELDGRAFHTDFTARDADLDRDLVRELTGAGGVRLGWGQVVGRPCLTAARVGRLLQQRGWAGEVHTARCCS